MHRRSVLKNRIDHLSSVRENSVLTVFGSICVKPCLNLNHICVARYDKTQPIIIRATTRFVSRHLIGKFQRTGLISKYGENMNRIDVPDLE